VAKAQTTSQQMGLTRGKAILIGVLSVALVVIVYVQYSRLSGGAAAPASEAAASTPLSTRAARPSRSARVKAEAASVDSDGATQAALLEFDQAKWKPPELARVVAYDPFALPASFPQPPRLVDDSADAIGETSEAMAEARAKEQADALEELQAQLEDLQQRGVHVIFSQNQQYVAMIGDRTVHVGDEINGFTVTEIDPKAGVRVERIETE
jgi:hypothetical protein